jgi:hypothetical protein
MYFTAAAGADHLKTRRHRNAAGAAINGAPPIAALGAAFLCAMAGLAFCTSARAADPAQELEQTLQHYEAAWSRHDAQAIASFYFEPAMRVSKSGPVIRATRADQHTFFDGYLRALIARGYERSDWESLETRLLDAQTAVASGISVRYRADGSVLERVAVTYELWRSAATHAPQSVLRFR